eukprot:CAMPEP_0119259246 /NCGR_PEP_ID=MMETSP1329-20130426/142_1 /TAXON_ID=114041 /ORGANISM="Genus nov. species nov., Strain RCC1024" /LENGTH=80 /DNA_ID=CAMNT_0007258615 /DNA_START=110 /DNA_END=352 /DNA_ORIENTATION=-
MSFLATQVLRNVVARAVAPARTLRRNMGGGHDDHHAHGTFDGEPFNKMSIGISTVAVVVGGAGTICFAAFFQNKKHGFIK